MSARIPAARNEARRNTKSYVHQRKLLRKPKMDKIGTGKTLNLISFVKTSKRNKMLFHDISKRKKEREVTGGKGIWKSKNSCWSERKILLQFFIRTTRVGLGAR